MSNGRKYEKYKSSEIRGELKDDAVGQSAAIKSDFMILRLGIKASVKSLIVLTLPIAIFILIMFSTSLLWQNYVPPWSEK